VSPVRYELGFYIPEDGILHSHRRENLTLYNYHNYSRRPSVGRTAFYKSVRAPFPAIGHFDTGSLGFPPSPSA
jgi:hypothetical protein